MNINDLVKAGKLFIGQELVWNSRKGRRTCTITPDSELQISNGKKFKTPSGAAKFLNGGKNVDGWLTWAILDTETKSYIKLNDLRKN